jgi:hypothetical protein
MIEFIDFALLVNAKTFTPLEKIADKFKNYTLEGIRKRLNKLCRQGLMESLIVKNKTFFRTTARGCKAALDFYESQGLEEFRKFLELS